MTQSLDEWIELQHIEPDSPQLSIIIPDYNDEKRLAPTLVDTIDYCENRGINYEIIVVDDGSKDGTSGIVNKINKIRSQVKLIKLPKNYGKGHAVKTGMLNAHGQILLFADADGSTPITEFEKLEKAIADGAQIAIGSRAMPSIDTSVKTHLHRKIMGRIFNFFVNQFLLPNIADTQCGFKLFTAEAADFLFKMQRSNQFSFDLELLFIARRAGLKIQEIPVNWKNASGSKVNLITDSIKMFKDIFCFKIRYSHITPSDFASHTLAAIKTDSPELNAPAMPSVSD